MRLVITLSSIAVTFSSDTGYLQQNFKTHLFNISHKQTLTKNVLIYPFLLSYMYVS